MIPHFEALPTLETKAGRSRHLWPLSTDPEFLEVFLTDLFTNYWDQLIYGPILEGAAYELMCPSPPTQIDTESGFMTIRFGLSHFHLCLGQPGASPSAHPKPYHPKQALIFRQLDQYGAPIAWGFELINHAQQPMLTIYFASPFVDLGDRVLDTPQWDRLAMWRDITQRYLNRPVDIFDESGRGFVDGNF